MQGQNDTFVPVVSRVPRSIFPAATVESTPIKARKYSLVFIRFQLSTYLYQIALEIGRTTIG